MLEADQIKLDLTLVSSIMNYAGYEGLLNYLSIETYKKNIKDEYLDFSKFEPYSFFNQKKWECSMDRLVEMSLVVKNKDHYISRKKNKDWFHFCENKTPMSNSLNGFIVFNLTELYKKRQDKHLKDYIYLSLVENVLKGKSYSRNFIKKITGIKPQQQRAIEDRHKGTIVLEVQKHHIPVNDNEIKNKKVRDIPVFNGVVSPKHMVCHKTSKNNSNCNVIQLGNKLKIKDQHISYFQIKKTFKKSKSLNDELKSSEVQDWEDFDMVLDTSKKARSNKFKGILSVKDTRRMSWKDFHHYDYDRVGVISENGTLVPLRTLLNQ
jgi:hypothetical protein